MLNAIQLVHKIFPYESKTMMFKWQKVLHDEVSKVENVFFFFAFLVVRRSFVLIWSMCQTENDIYQIANYNEESLFNKYISSKEACTWF